jgi:ATP phosphoribosyltransferase regulatory subunit
MINLEPAPPPQVLEAIRRPFLAMGAAMVDAPVMQPLSLLLDLAGEAMRARLFSVQAGGIEEACLRPDFTLPVVRAHIDSGAAHGRYLYEGKAFRVAPPDSGAAEEFLQIGVEIYEAGDAAALDAAIVSLAWQAARAGGRDDLSLQLGDVALYGAFIAGLGLAPALQARMTRAFLRPRVLKAQLERGSATPPAGEADRLPALLAGLPEGEATAVLEELWALAGIQPVGGRSAAEIVHRLALRAEDGAGPRLTAAQADLVRRYLAISDQPSRAVDQVAGLAREAGADLTGPLQDWTRRLGGLGLAEADIRLSCGFGREFGYYDGFLFEVRSAALGDGRPVAAGGRYDGLLARLGVGRSAERAGGAVGCMVRPWRAFAGAAA